MMSLGMKTAMAKDFRELFEAIFRDYFLGCLRELFFVCHEIAECSNGARLYPDGCVISILIPNASGSGRGGLTELEGRAPGARLPGAGHDAFEERSFC